MVCGYNYNMTQLSRFINLMIEFQEKIESHLNKKYKSFLRSVINLDALTKNTKPDRILVTRELMVFKLGLEAKSAKAVEISLSYLLKCFNMKFIEVGMPNPCENYVIEQSGVRQQQAGEVKTEVRHLLIDLIKKNLIYKNAEIHQLILKILENLISEPILPILLDIAIQYPQEAINQVLYNYFSFRFYVYQEICFYSEKELQSFATINKNERSEKEIKAALKEDELLGDLISKYMNEYLSIIEKEGGRYGNCVMCAQPADHYCKITKASLCGLDCKKKHIEMAEHQYKHYFQAVNLWETIESSFQQLLIFLQTHESPLVFAVFTKLLDKPHLFMVTKQNFRTLLAKHVPHIMLRVLNYKNESAFENIYQFAVSITKNWLYECLSTVEHFFRDYILKVLDEKKPLLRFLNMICKALARIFEQGKVTVQLFINFDCEVNRLNIVQKVLFQISRILQDRFGHGSHLSKQQRLSVKNNFLSLAIIIAMGLNEYRKQQPKQIDTSEISTLKQKKISLQQFVLKFNEGWTSGLKTLFNLNLVGLDSNEQIVDILMNMKGINKEKIDELFFCQKGIQLFQIFAKKISRKHHKNLLLALIELHHYIPLKISSIGIKKFLERYKFHCQVEQVQSQATNWMNLLARNYTRLQFGAQLVKYRPDIQVDHSIQKLYVLALQTKQIFTVGNHKTYFTYCCSRSYLDVIASQIALLQIPLSFMLETDYQIERILALVEELVQICAHSNWISLLTKSSSIAKYPSAEFDEIKLKIVLGVLEIIEKHAYFIQDWSTIINFLAKLYRIVLKVRAQSDSKVILQMQVPIARIERCLMEASAKSEPHFNKLLLAMLVVGRQELQRDNLFMIQKFFEAIDRNLKTFLSIAQQFLPYLSNFMKNVNESSIEAAITIADMLKQTFAKLLKLPKTGNSWAENCQAQFWKLFQTLGNHKSNEVNDFVVNCVSMSVLHHYDISYKSWIVLFSFMKRRVLEYRAQFHTILQKIINSKLKGCEQFGHDLVVISLNILHPKESKTSIQSLHLLKSAMDMISDNKINGSLASGKEQDMKSAKQQIKQILKQILLKLIDCLYYQCHEYIIEHFFRLMKFKVNGDALLIHEETHQMINELFKKIETFDLNTLQIAEKTLSYSLNWSVANKYPQIVQHLEKLVVDKYNNLSFSAVRCLKTYIQIINPKTEAHWEPIQTTFLHILQNTRISHLVDLNIPNLFEDSSVLIELRDVQLRLDVGLFANKLTIQKYITDILPNHQKCIEEMIQLHREVIKFNDNLYLRVLLWRRGLGISDTEHPPNLLALEESLASKIIATYQNLSKTNELFNFAYQNFKRYCSFSQLLIETNQKWAAMGMHEGRQSQNWELYTDYLRLRKIPLFRILNYFLPKLKRFCIERDQKKSIMLKLVECCKYMEQREGVLKAIKDLTHRQS